MEKIKRYVKESVESDGQGEFWPVIKKVSIGMPASKVCRGGTVLVDLPGSRDCNAARDNVAQKVGFALYILISNLLPKYMFKDSTL